MTQPTSFQLLHELASRRREGILRQMGLSMAALASKQRKREFLQKHRDALERGDPRLSGEPVSAAQWNNRLSHSARVADAIRESERTIAIDLERIQAQRQLLAAIESKRKAFEVILDRERNRTAEIERKREQKQTDEIAAMSRQRRQDPVDD